MPKAGLLRCPAQSALRLLGEALKRGRIFNREISKDLAVEFDTGSLQAVNELAVAHAVQFGGGADTHNPQRAELAFALFASGVGELQTAIDRFFRRAVEL